MAEYRVEWVIELEADSPYEAAKLALATQRRAHSSAVVFDVFDVQGEKVRIDLDDDEFAEVNSEIATDEQGLRFFAAARNDGWYVGDEDTPEEYCFAFVPDDELLEVDVEQWREEFELYRKSAA